MKVIRYNIHSSVNIGTEEHPNMLDIFTPVELGWNEANEEIAKREAYKGEYTIEDDGKPEPESVATADDVLNAMLGVM